MKTNTLLIIVNLMMLIISCKKDPDAPTGGNKILIGITTVDTLSYLFAKVSTQLNSTGGNQISQHGHCWSIESSPDIEDSHTTLGSITSPRKFTSDLSGLSDNTKYFIRPYFTFQGGTIYGIQKGITTLKRGKPVVNTGVASEITISSVKITGSSTFDSGFSITQKGICWDTTAYPTLLKSIGHSEEGAGIGAFISSITGLLDNKVYHFCSYATNERGTSYGVTNQLITVAITQPTVSTLDVTNITLTSAVSGGFVSNAGNGTVSTRGVCWNASGNPTLTNCINKTQDGSGIGNFSSQISGLLQGTIYFVAAYATNEKGTSYGLIKQFTTTPIVKPSVTTASINNIMNTAAMSGGNVTNSGNGTIIARGVCWSTSINPTIANNHSTNGTGAGVFTSNLTNLTGNTLYYVCAYATNEVGTCYGNELTFTTLPNPVIPTVSTTAVTNITSTTATCGGNVVSDGGSPVTVRGVCWSQSSNPTIGNSHTSDGTGIGSFISTLTSLSPNSFYFVRAYATNIAGTSYGNSQTFSTLLPTCGTMTINHVAGTTAPVTKTVTYGTVTNITGEPSKCWITSNLGADHQATAVNDGTEASAGWYWQFNRKQGYKHDG
ncbi:MAG: hypothetical protein WCJ26_11825, partial [bacterium]